jgi:glucose/arabinose dehydrogenase
MAAGRPFRTVALLAVLASALVSCGGRDPEGGGAQGRGSSTIPSSSGPSTVPPPGATKPPTPFGPPTQAELDRVAVQPVQVAKLAQPVALAVAGDGKTLYVGERAGRVRAVRAGRPDPRPLLDLSGEVAVEGEGGLLGVAAAPGGDQLYVSFTDRRRAVRLVEVTLGAGGAAGSRRDVLTVPQPSVRHHGGNLVFGPDGLLWLGLGDGSAGGDPDDAAQSLAVLRGKLLRLEPTPTATARYTVPRTNPFVGRRGARGEIWAYGLRNPWRFSFDRATGDLWIGDVGQYIIEEIDMVAPRRAAGANFGWNRLEGRRRFRGSPPPHAVAPVYQYNHDGGRCAVIGGYVYRGSQVGGLQGAYLYGDVCDGRIRALARTPGGALRHRDLGVRIPGLVSFAEDAAGELYALSLAGGIYRLTPGS